MHSIAIVGSGPAPPVESRPWIERLRKPRLTIGLGWRSNLLLPDQYLSD